MMDTTRVLSAAHRTLGRSATSPLGDRRACVLSVVWAITSACGAVPAIEPPATSADPSVARTGSGPADPVSTAGASEPQLTTGRVEFDTAQPAALEIKRTPTGHLLVRPTINGVQPGWFIFDTGAGICVVSTPHTEEFNLISAGSVDAEGVGGSAAKPLYRATTLMLGPVTLHDEPIMATDLSFLKQFLGEEIVGVVGFGVLSACVTELDIAGPRIALFDPAGYTLGEGEWSPLNIDDRIPVVRAKFEDREGLFRIDTGANGFVTFHQPAVEKWKLLEGREALGPVTDSKLGGVGGFVKAKKGTVAWFELGGVRRENIEATFALEAKGTFADTRKDGNIGAELLRPFTIVLDYGGKRVAFVAKAKE